MVAKPGLVTWTNNALDWSHMTDFDFMPDVIFDELSRVSHPLCRPAETLRAYQRLWKSVPPARARVAASKRAVGAS